MLRSSLRLLHIRSSLANNTKRGGRNRSGESANSHQQWQQTAAPPPPPPHHDALPRFSARSHRPRLRVPLNGHPAGYLLVAILAAAAAWALSEEDARDKKKREHGGRKERVQHQNEHASVSALAPVPTILPTPSAVVPITPPHNVNVQPFSWPAAPPSSSSTSSFASPSPAPVTLNLLTTLSPSEVAAHPLLTHIAPYGLPALPFIPAPSQVDGSSASAPFHLSPPLFLRHAFLSAYNTQRRTADWCLERLVGSGREAAAESTLSTSTSNNSTTRDSCSFALDPLISAAFQAHPSSYRHSGFDRGHLVPAADVGSGGEQQAMCETFVLSNVAPQVAQFNRGYWLQLEHHVRKLAERHGEVFVVTGPMWIPQQQVEGAKGNADDTTPPQQYMHIPVLGAYPLSFVHVPSHFYKIILVPNKNGSSATSSPPHLAAFILPNAPLPLSRPLTDFSAPLLQVELITGWRFFPHVRATDGPGGRGGEIGLLGRREALHMQARDLCEIKGACEMKIKDFQFKQSPTAPSSPK